MGAAMLSRKLAVCVIAASASTFCPGPGYTQPYPHKLIRIVTTDTGSNLDIVTRVVAQSLTPSLGQPVIVQNRAGVLAIDTVIKAGQDGYTLLVLGTAVWIIPLMQKVTFDPMRDLTPVTLVANAPLFLFTHPSVPAKTVRELIAVAKASPGTLNYGMAGAGASNHLAAELFKSMAGIDLLRIAYKGSGQAMAALMANQVQIVFSSAPTGIPHVATGRLRVLAVGSTKPSVLAPDVPTMAASGVPGFEAGSTIGMWAPAHTPKAVIDRLANEMQRVLNAADVKEKFLSNATEAVGGTPAEAAAYIKNDSAKWRKLVKEADLRID